MATQVFVKSLTGHSLAFDVHQSDTIGWLKERVADREGIPVSQQRIIYRGRLLDDGTMSLMPLSQATLALFIPLLGGKGGFGSNLRAEGKKAVIDNYDACRDLQGRRILHRSAQEKLEEWKKEEAERELEKVAMKHLKEREKEEKRQQKVEVDVRKIRSDTKQTLQEVREAVKNGTTGGGGGGGGGERVGGGNGNTTSSGVKNKKNKKMDALLLLEDSDDDDDSDDAEGDDDKEKKVEEEKKHLKKRKKRN